MKTEVSVEGLIEDGFLDLEAVLGRAEWQEQEVIATYTACIYGPEGGEPGQIEIVLEQTCLYGIRAWRLVQRDCTGVYRHDAPPTVDKEEAVEEGRQFAQENDNEPDIDLLIQEVIETGYFGSAGAENIRAICQAATEYSQGYLILPKGTPVAQPIGRMWTTSGYLHCEDYVALNATHKRVSYAAYTLLQLIKAEEEE